MDQKILNLKLLKNVFLSMLIKKKLIDRLTCDVDEVKDKNLATGFYND